MEESFVSVIIPCRNEKHYIKNLLDSLIKQGYPKDKMEILIADGMSEDGTREVIKDFQKKYPFLKLLDNLKKYTPSALNAAIRSSQGDIIIRLDSHATYQKDYILQCVKYLHKYGADNVGGTMKTVPANTSLQARAIALCMSHGVGVGNSYFRKSASRRTEKPKEVDTMFGGCYKREVFDKIGLFNENLIRSQDMEFNMRLKKAGGKIILVPDIVSYYYPKATFKEFLKHNFLDGQWAILPFKFTRQLFKPRHYVLFFFVTALLVLGLAGIFAPIARNAFVLLVFLYIAGIMLSSLSIAIQEKNIGLLVFMPIAFAIRHFGYGTGSIVGVIKLFRT